MGCQKEVLNFRAAMVAVFMVAVLAQVCRAAQAPKTADSNEPSGAAPAARPSESSSAGFGNSGNDVEIAGVWNHFLELPMAGLKFSFGRDGKCEQTFSFHFAARYQRTGNVLAVTIPFPKPGPLALAIGNDSTSLQLAIPELLAASPNCALRRDPEELSTSDPLVGTWKPVSCDVKTGFDSEKKNIGYGLLVGQGTEWKISPDGAVTINSAFSLAGRYTRDGAEVHVDWTDFSLSDSTEAAAPLKAASKNFALAIIDGRVLLVSKDRHDAYVKDTDDPDRLYLPWKTTAENQQVAQSAIAEYLRRVQLNPQDLKSVTALAYLYAATKEPDLARPYYLAAIKLDPGGAQPYYAIALLDWRQSFEHRMAVRNKPGENFTEPIADPAACQDLKALNAKRVDEGMRMLDEVLKLSPNLVGAETYYNLLWREKADLECGDADRRAEDLKNAAERSQRALELQKQATQSRELSITALSRPIFPSPLSAHLRPPSNFPVLGGVPGGVPGGTIGGVLSAAAGDAPTSPPLPGNTAPMRIRVGGLVESAKLISQPKPDYPPLARTARVQGVVRLDAIIGKDGTIEDLKVISGHPLLVKAALDAVQHWQYQPTFLNGEPVEVATEIDVNFSLADGAASTGLAEAGNPQVSNGPGLQAGVVTPPVPTYKPDPPYTQEARKAKIEGIVTLAITIDAQGDVTDCQVTDGLDKGLDQQAITTVRTWKFKPALRNGIPVAVRVSVVVNFKLF